MTNKTEPPDLDRLEALARAATPGEWTARPHGRVVGGPMRHYVNGSAQAQIAAFSVTFHEQAPDDEPERQQANTEFCAAANPAAVLALIALARRAQPEGEAPQAVPVADLRTEIEKLTRYKHCMSYNDSYFTEPAGMLKQVVFQLDRLLSAPAAQHAEALEPYDADLSFAAHKGEPGAVAEAARQRAQQAESGAPAAAQNLELVITRLEQIAGNFSDDYREDAQQALVCARAALAAQSQDTGLAKLALEQAKARLAQADARIEELEAAQSQGAQAKADAVELLGYVFDAWENGVDCYEVPENNAGYLGMAFKLDDDVFQRCVELLNRENPPRNAALAAKAEAPAPRHKSCDAIGCAACGYTGRAQQAAAPGALANYKLVPLEPTPEMQQAGFNVHGAHMHNASYRAMVAAAPSAPGTPEAPADDELLEAVARAIWNIRREEEDRCDMELEDMGDDHPVWDEAEAAIAAIRRAAQLDGGQGEGASHE